MHYGVIASAGWNSDAGENWCVYRRGNMTYPWSVSQSDVDNGCPTVYTDGKFSNSGKTNYKMSYFFTIIPVFNQ